MEHTPDREDDDFDPLIKELLDENRSTNIRGAAGSGKSTFVNKLQKAMDSRGIKYIALAPTNKAARIIQGQTIQGFIARASSKMLKEMDVKYFFVDEVSMMPEMFYKFFCTLKRLRPELQFIMAGDFRQFLPVNDRVEGCNYEDSSALRELCNNNMIHLTKCRRSDDRVFKLCQPANIGNIKTCELGNKITKRHICFTNKKRKELNEHMMQLEAKTKETRNKATIIELEALDYDDNSQKVKVYAGLPVIARVNSKDFDLCNNDTMTVSKVRLKSKLIKITREDSSKFDVMFDMFQKLFHPAYAITSHKAQGSTYDHPYTIWEWNHARFDNRAKYVVLSRSKKYEHINIRDG
jgi:ATP-dependent exoDNAse (exonuclease V) alpha subunit